MADGVRSDEQLGRLLLQLLGTLDAFERRLRLDRRRYRRAQGQKG
jgi:DNA invertase Pin-like site-specific DNA recombinase